MSRSPTRPPAIQVDSAPDTSQRPSAGQRTRSSVLCHSNELVPSGPALRHVATSTTLRIPEHYAASSPANVSVRIQRRPRAVSAVAGPRPMTPALHTIEEAPSASATNDRPMTPNSAAIHFDNSTPSRFRAATVSAGANPLVENSQTNSTRRRGATVSGERPRSPLRRPIGRRQQSDNRSLLDRVRSAPPTEEDRVYSQRLVDFMDVLDPEVGTISTLSNVQNSLFIPNLGGLINRAPSIRLDGKEAFVARRYERLAEENAAKEFEEKEAKLPTITPAISRQETEQSKRTSATSVPEGGEYAMLPDGVDWSDWTDAEREELDDYVRYLMTSKKEQARRKWKGFLQFVSKPLGAFVFIYSTLLFLFAWILFIIGWISVQGRQEYFINVCDSVLTALFILVGLGLAPWRAVDTYHMIYIAHFHRKSLRLRQEKKMPELPDENDLPNVSQDVEEQAEESVLSPEEQTKFLHHQTKFAKSHTFYKPHATFTHYAFPLDLMIVTVCLLDAHSIFQANLAAFTWGWSYHTRPRWITAVILSCSISCNITAGLVITVGDHRTRKKEIFAQKLRQALTEEAMRRKRMEERLAKRRAANETTEATQALTEMEKAAAIEPVVPYPPKAHV